MPDLGEDIFICFDCVDERGYRIPLHSSVEEKVGKCAYCGHYGVIVNIDDLVPPGEDP